MQKNAILRNVRKLCFCEDKSDYNDNDNKPITEALKSRFSQKLCLEFDRHHELIPCIYVYGAKSPKT
jgi:hypothetical protein